ncbi:MAG TPA: pyridoxal 5'-phosphate synthase glutaminase subunit PdxT [Lachnoclostridium sp.]|mgnify:CR=1 FL=1|uniref:Pyridoxal 5'-phosphate synthase subunit PdxT n=1 Tax=[Clostridium] celerecrescens 18A TaxID=1286362 RepID=A0A2M8YZM7_9FIRM|nr:pyridoxal 5'-phosphate synthase glutaminase subunit PdxT [Lacrimispora celerecrescens]PJJ26644.1 5'-phosphate synthase pdxT subunit [[Clostridium] celerecrescens 18A]HBE85614.1 pyridoxal 5'-phosphate synthase glutaminase subunit PdxT [Lachnoclostridium sp.]
MRIGILALQGAFTEHEKMLSKLGADSFEIRQRADFTEAISGLILPGGESTVMEKLMRESELKEPILQMIQRGIPVMGTCAGMILLAKTVIGGESHLACMDITVERNAYGRQLASFKTESKFGGTGIIPMVFIRAPYVADAGQGVEVLAKVDGKIVAAREKNMLACAFHPELTEDTTVHSYFLHMCR